MKTEQLRVVQVAQQSIPDDVKPVLGLFANEAELRDYIADRLHLIEKNLTFLAKEYRLDNPDGSGGRVDIIAKDSFRHVLCIELKRSTVSSRTTLNELSKYVSLLVAKERVTKEAVRCVVISTDWKDLLLPLSFFAKFAGVQVVALQAVRDGNEVALKPVPLIDLAFLPHLSPDMDLVRFPSTVSRSRSLEIIYERAKRLPFVQIAAMLFDPIDPAAPETAYFPMMLCVWRIPDGLQDKIETVIGQPIGADSPYAAPGWEPEADAMDWITSITSDQVPEYNAHWTHGTAEKLNSLLSQFTLVGVERIGDWPQLNLVNDDNEILEAALASSPFGGAGRANRYHFRMPARPSVEASWRVAVDAFMSFISFEPAWSEKAKQYLDLGFEPDTDVLFIAFDARHLPYSMHMARFQPDTTLSFFEIVLLQGDVIVGALRGDYCWDGTTCPSSAKPVIDNVYGGIIEARLAFLSAVDDRRFDAAFALHGFVPAFSVLDQGEVYFSEPIARSLSDFVAANPAYVASMSELLESVGPIPL